jgi:hypothetical protein
MISISMAENRAPFADGPERFQPPPAQRVEPRQGPQYQPTPPPAQQQQLYYYCIAQEMRERTCSSTLYITASRNQAILTEFCRSQGFSFPSELFVTQLPMSDDRKGCDTFR